MKFGRMNSVAHNIAASVASGMGFMIGLVATDIFGEAEAGQPGFIAVDFLTGETSGSPVSPQLANALNLYCGAVPELCRRQAVDFSEFAELTASFSKDAVQGPTYLVTVRDMAGRHASNRFAGYTGEKIAP